MNKIISSALDGSARGTTDSASRRRRRSKLVSKRGMDVGVALLLLLLFSPLFLVLALVVLAVQGRPLFIRHRRVGKDGKLFPCLKFRTMTRDADAVLHAHIASDSEARAEWEATRKLKVDPRVTPLGAVMRKLSVDELPQFINVLRGEMSLVGPRPIVTDEIKFYGSEIHLYHSVRPGLTGSWQVAGRSDVSYSRRVQMDADYVTNWSLVRDLSILARTVPAVLRSRGSY